MTEKLEECIRNEGFILLDGGLATALESEGFKHNTDLWSAFYLQDDEHAKAIHSVHCKYLEAGADIITTASYQASLEGFKKVLGFNHEQSVAAFRRAADIAVKARDLYWKQMATKSSSGTKSSSTLQTMKPMVAASLGCYGAILAGGQEYTGEYGDITDAQLRAFHLSRLNCLGDAVEILAFETVPCIREARIICELLRDPHESSQTGKHACESKDERLDFPWSRLPVWLVFSCRDEAHISNGELLADGIRAVVESHAQNVFAVGINCTKPQYATSLICIAKQTLEECGVSTSPISLASSVPSLKRKRVDYDTSSVQTSTDNSGISDEKQRTIYIICYPNSGEQFDGETHQWVGGSADGIDKWVASSVQWHKAGARIIGGCCRTHYDHVRCLRRGLSTKKSESTTLP